MDYISAEEFLKQPERAQKAFMDWWKPQPIDLYFDKELNNIYMVLDSENNMNVWESLKSSGKIVPLFAEGQLREFIEEKTKASVEIHFFDNKIKYFITASIPFKDDYKVFESHCNVDLLQSYWQIACKIAKEGC